MTFSLERYQRAEREHLERLVAEGHGWDAYARTRAKNAEQFVPGIRRAVEDAIAKRDAQKNEGGDHAGR